MADRYQLRLAKINSSKRGTFIEIRSLSYSSIIDMINLRGDEYPSLSNLDSYNHGNTFMKKITEFLILIDYINSLHTLE